MGSGEQTGLVSPRNWRVDLGGAVGGAVGAALALLVGKQVDFGRFWAGLIAFMVVVGVSVYLGRLAGSLVFRSPPGNGHHS